MKQHIIAVCVVSFCGLAVVWTAARDTDSEWARTRFGRVSPHPGNWTMDAETVQEFQPSGVGSQIYRAGEYTILHNHGLYWSDEENQDTSHDMHASVIIFKDNKRVFVGRGYRYDNFQVDLRKSRFSFNHWTGTMGDNQITCFEFHTNEKELKLTTRKRSTKE